MKVWFIEVKELAQTLAESSTNQDKNLCLPGSSACDLHTMSHCFAH